MQERKKLLNVLLNLKLTVPSLQFEDVKIALPKDINKF